MTRDLQHHPCFNRKAHHRFGRVHLPVAPRCNIQCKFCNRLFDCVNESRPGVTSAVLSPDQAMIYLAEVLREKPNIAVVGIAGPGDPFANPVETLATLEQVKARYPDMMLCLATNGLNLHPYLDDLARLRVSHVTVTVNAVDPQVGARIYSWMRIDKKVVPAERGFPVLLERQLAAIQGLKRRGILVKVNSIILPGINDSHIVDVARRMGELGVDIFNCMPLYPSPGSALSHLAEPSAPVVAAIRKQAGEFVPQMTHCTRCRADAVGLLGEAPSPTLTAKLQQCSAMSAAPPRPEVHASERPYVAAASREGLLINQHLGEARQLLIYGLQGGSQKRLQSKGSTTGAMHSEADGVPSDGARCNGQDMEDICPGSGRIALIEARPMPEAGGGNDRWRQMAARLADCRALLVADAGEKPSQVLASEGIRVVACEGLIEEALRRVFAGESLAGMAARRISPCGGTGQGCGA